MKQRLTVPSRDEWVPGRRAKQAPRLLFASAALLQLLGGLFHARAFFLASAAVAESNLNQFFGGSFKALWLAEAATMLVMAAILAFLAARPSSTARVVIILLALIPLAVSALIYVFIGPFLAGHLLFLTALVILLAGLLRSEERTQTGAGTR